MYTQCPNCSTLFEVRAANLRLAMGMVRCTNCATVFNALASLQDDHEIQPGQAISVGIQLPVREFGDELVIDPGFLAQQRWYIDALEAAQRSPVPGAIPVSGENRSGEKASSTAAAQSPPQAPPPPAADAGTAMSGARDRWSDFLSSAVRGALGETFSLALLNLSRHRRRTALGLSAIAIGITALVVAGGFAEWMIWIQRESTIHSRLGHVQIVKKDYFRKGIAEPHAFLIESDEINVDVLRTLPGVKEATPRLQFSGLISLGDTTVSFLGEGLVPDNEVHLSRDVNVHDGVPLNEAGESGILLGKGLAANLDAMPGDTVVLMVNTQEGGISAVEATVSGVFHTASKAFDEVALRAPLSLAQQLMQSNGVHRVVVLLDETRLTAGVVQMLRELIPEERTDFEIVPWRDLADFSKAVEELFTAQTNFVRVVIGFIIIMTISNTLVMSVMERTSEIGTLMAVGLRRRRIMRLFVSEGFLLGLAGGVIGIVVGYVSSYAIAAVGIPMPPAPGMDVGFTASVRVTPELVASSFLVAVSAAVLASLYPAWKAANLNIVDALRRAR